MIATPENPKDALADLARQAENIFKPSGLMDEAHRAESLAFEIRPQQSEMAKAVAEALAGGRHLAAEAGTGVGKTFAYLAPCMLFCLETEKQAAVATYTISLQEQIVHKDIPFLQRHFGGKLVAALCKGRTNYICLRRLDRAERMGYDLFTAAKESWLARLREWVKHTDDGSLSDFDEQPPQEIWENVCSEHDNCMGRNCNFQRQCFLARARARAFSANILILNHHLFFSDLSLRAENAAFLPEFPIVVLDEAHCLEQAATEHFGLRLSQSGFARWLRRLYAPDTGKGLLPALKARDAERQTAAVWTEMERFMAEVKAWAGFDGTINRRVVEKPLEISAPVRDSLNMMLLMLRGLARGTEDPDLKTELNALERRGLAIGDMISSFLAQSLDDHVYWVETFGRRANIALHSAPIEIGPILEKELFDRFDSVVMTSATISIGGKLDYFRNRIGARDCMETVVGSPFDYETQMKIYLVRGMPSPNDPDMFPDAATEAIKFFVAKTGGRAFVLFTNARLMRTVAGQIRDFAAENGYNLLVQGEGVPKHLMLKKFTQPGAHILFGLDSFRIGVDVRGEALSNVIIVRLPFSVPDEPVVRARIAKIQERGGDPFREYSLPEAALRFKQGVGRLIRTATDKGIVAILDPRIMTRWYGKIFLGALPSCPVEITSCPGISGRPDVRDSGFGVQDSESI